MGLKENIKMRRLAMGMTLEQVAKAVGVSKATLQRYESGVISNIPAEKIELLARALGTTPSTLMGWDNGDSDGELTEYLEQLKNRSEMRMLFRLAKNASKTDVEKAVRIIEALKSTGEGY
jgi:transcriptional regulator with XRE-family HTH domain